MEKRMEYLAYSMLRDWQERKIADFDVDSLFGDASGRQYFRVFFESQSVVLMKVAEVKPGEFGRGDSFLDFIEMQEMISSVGLNVPKILLKNTDEKALLLQDLGDTTMYQWIKEHPLDKSALIYKAVDLLIEWQNKMWSRKEFKSPGDRRTFKAKLFMDEFYHFHEYMVEKRIYYPSWKGIWSKSEKYFQKITKELCNSPYILSHRDFQSKNIMIKKEKHYIIDFQDALMAPIVYDLVALLRDSYIELLPNELEMLLNHYWDNNESAREIYISKEYFLRLFYLQTVQRKMKDSGRFIYLHQVKGKEWFVPFVRPSLFYVKDALMKLNMPELLTIYAPFISEFGSESK